MGKYRYFCIIGAQRCGTTWLTRQLSSHPEIQLAKPLVPEPKYFITHSSPNCKEYLNSYFTLNSKSPTWIGEKSTSYIEYPEVGLRIQKCFPNPRIMVVLRNPVDRAISNYKFSVENGLEKRSISEVFLEKKEKPKLDRKISVDPFDYLSRGCYIKYLKPWIELFSHNHLNIWLYEEIVGSEDGLSKVVNSLDLCLSEKTINLETKINESSELYNPELKEVRQVLKQFYKPYNRALGQRIGLNISDWE